MKVLASYPDGRASIVAMKGDLAILAGAGAEWSQRLRRIADRAPSLDIFSEGYVVRDDAGWQLTDLGRKMLRILEGASRASAAELTVVEETTTPIVEETPSSVPPPPSPKLIGVHDRQRRRRRPVAMDRSA